MNWNFPLPVELVFGSGTRHEIKSYIEKIGGTRGVLVCGKSFLRNGTADAFLQAADGALVSVFSDIRPNPTTENVNACAAEMRRVEADWRWAAARPWTVARRLAPLPGERTILNRTITATSR